MNKAFRWRRFIFFMFGAMVALTAMTAIFLEQAYRQPMELYEQRVISGQIKEVWRVATDVNRWPEWDPHEEAGEIFGAFVEGTRGFSKPRGGPGAHWTLTEVTENRS